MPQMLVDGRWIFQPEQVAFRTDNRLPWLSSTKKCLGLVCNPSGNLPLLIGCQRYAINNFRFCNILKCFIDKNAYDAMLILCTINT